MKNVDAVTIKIETSNDAFAGSPIHGEAELALILRELAYKIGQGNYPKVLMDSNGNSVGKVEYAEDFDLG